MGQTGLHRALGGLHLGEARVVAVALRLVAQSGQAMEEVLPEVGISHT